MDQTLDEVRARRARARRASARRAASVGATATATVTVVDEVERIGTDVHGQGDETRAERGDGGGPGR